MTKMLINEGIDLGIGEQVISDSESEYEEVSVHSKSEKGEEDKEEDAKSVDSFKSSVFSSE